MSAQSGLKMDKISKLKKLAIIFNHGAMNHACYGHATYKPGLKTADKKKEYAVN